MLAIIIKKAIRLGYRLTTLGLSKGPHITRYYMYNHLQKFSEFRPVEHRVLSISHSERLGKLLGYADNQIETYHIPTLIL